MLCDDALWEIFLLDNEDEEREPEPEPGDFWQGDDEGEAS